MASGNRSNDHQTMSAQAAPCRMQENVTALTAVRRTNPHFDVADQLFKQKVSWPELIKTLRQVYGVHLFEAQKLALAHEGWRRWCEAQINAHAECRKEALRHMRHQGDVSLVTRNSDRLQVG